ncbi:DAD1 [Sanghuangporus weigelae]
MPDDEQTFFDKERDRLSSEIASGFEHLLTASNLLNRKLEEVLGMTREYDTIASLWARFHALMRVEGGAETIDDANGDESLIVPLHDTTIVANPNAPSGLPGTGGYTLQVPPSARKADA